MSKIVITSVGVCHSTGMSLDSFSSYFQAGKGIESSPFLVKGTKLEQELSKYMEYGQSRRLDRFSKMALVAALSCSRSLKSLSDHYKNELGVVINTNLGALNSSEEFIKGALENGIKNASPLIFPFTVPNAASGVVTIQLGIRGFNTTISGYNPVGYAYDLLKLEKGKGFFVGGIEEYSRQLLKIKNVDNPFYSHLLSEGAGFLFMTTDDFARENGMDVLFTVDQFNTACNINNQYTIDNSEGIEESTIVNVLQDICKNDQKKLADTQLIVSSFLPDDPLATIEKRAISQILPHALPPVIYPKSWLGETFGATSTLNTITGYCISHSESKEGKTLICNYDIGGNYSCLTIKS